MSAGPVRLDQHLPIVAIFAYVQSQTNNKIKKRRRRRYPVRPWISRRIEYGQYHTLMQELMREAEGDFYGFLRMTPGAFQEILLRVSPRITKVRPCK